MKLDDTLRTLMLITGSMMMSSLLFAVALFMIEFPEGEPPELGLIPLVMPVVALGSAGASFIVPALVYRPPEVTGLSPEEEVTKIAGFYQTRTLVTLAMCESVAIFGFVLGFLGQTPWWILPFVLTAIVLMALHFPRKSALIALLSPQAARFVERDT